MPKIKRIAPCTNGNTEYTMISFEKDWENGNITAPFAMNEPPAEVNKHLKVGDELNIQRL